VNSSVRLEAGGIIICGHTSTRTLTGMINVFVIVILNLKNVVVGMDNPQGIRGWPPFISGMDRYVFLIIFVTLFSSDHKKPMGEI